MKDDDDDVVIKILKLHSADSECVCGGGFPYFWVEQIVSRMLENLRFFFLTEGIALLIRCICRDFPPRETFGE